MIFGKGGNVLVVVLLLGWGILYANRTAFYPLLPVISQSLGISSARTGGLMSAYFFFYVLMQIPSGMAADRWGTRRVLVTMYAVAAAGMLGIGLFGGTYPLLLLFSAIHGFGAGAYYPCSYGTLLNAVPPEKRGSSSGYIGMGMALGILGGMTASGPLYAAFGNYRVPFLILAIPAFLMLPLFRRYIPQVRQPAPPSLAAYAALFRDRDIWTINLATFCSLYGFWVAATWGPTFLQVERGFSLSTSGAYTGLIALTALPGGVLWGKLSDRVGRKKIALLVLPCGAAALFLLTRVQSAAGIVATFLLFGAFSNTALSPVAVSWIGDIVAKRYPGSMNAAVGLFNGVIMSSAVIAPILSGMLRDATDSLIPAILGACLLMASGTLLLLRTPDGRSVSHGRRQDQ
mgnify:CR=1 FL=1